MTSAHASTAARAAPRVALPRASSSGPRASSRITSSGATRGGALPARNAGTTKRAVGPSRTRAARASASAAGSDDDDVHSVVVIGSGPAGYTAAIYAGRADLSPIVFEGFQAGGVPGGQLMTTTEVENFPGFPEGVTGPDLMDKMRKQAERWGATLHTEDVERVDFSVRPFVIESSERVVKAHSVILATGATAKRLKIPSEETFWSRGISACAICDGPSPIFKGEELAVVGGGDTATEEALYLTKYGKHVHLLVRGEKMKARSIHCKEMRNRVVANKQITTHYNTECYDAFGNAKGFLSGLNLRDTKTGETSKLAVKGMFYGIGHSPNRRCDDLGYVVIKDGGAGTSVPGVFSAGDLHDTEWMQAITAAGSGCMAAISAERYLGTEGLLVERDAKETKLKADKENEGDVEEESKATFDGDKVKHKGQFALRKLYHESDRVLMVLYSGPNCGPCKRLKPMLDKVLDEYGDDVHFVEIDIEKDSEIAQAAGISGTPCVQVFKNKERIEVMNGVKMKSVYREVIDKAAGKVPAR
ncbi:uncharacterized protein MICPUCDRAFT_23559 [Micromonas pusilla CCMP1545]|uniref:Predicted protein n=1 Tax=Micromonas pusilla (strain CCMP1545) TaxID=564608 RepID=C1N9L2_MICPC|nr:uncharacterized protein MICPUCDRAFT_23559 [Micromonas pusilla CCMP1545]EEH51377.1 predicted protein [Micromonas pusilla CCMP1545]|eukprot:XP_003064472.1 predicted protein [Micromonas pusilla CCMP1545]